MDWQQIIEDIEHFWEGEKDATRKGSLKFIGQISKIKKLGPYCREYEIWTERREYLDPSHPQSLLPGDFILLGESKKGIISFLHPERGTFRVMEDGPEGPEYAGQKLMVSKNNLLFLMERQQELWRNLEEKGSQVFSHLKGILTGELSLPKFTLPEVGKVPSFLRGLDKNQLLGVMGVVTTPDLWIIWGPPGTGKTHCLAGAIHLLLLQGKRVLLTSHQHVAVDQVLLKVIEKFPEHKNSILRIGHGGKIHPEIQPLLIQNRLLERMREDDDEEEIDEEDLIEQTPLVGATLSACAGPLLWDQEFDVVIEDEAGRPSIPLSLLGLVRARERFALVGDPLQLRPIVPRKTIDWLQKSILEMALEHSEIQQRKTELNIHRRSHPKLVEHTSNLYKARGHAGLEVPWGWQVQIPELPLSPEPVLDRETPLVYLNKPFPGSKWYKFGEAMSLVDPYEGALVYEVANLLAQEISYERIWILTPFRLQTYLIASLFRTEHQKKKLVSTIDQTQGGERDLVILSITADKKATLTNKIDFNRLNVALTRARAKLIVVANLMSLMETPSMEEFCGWLLDEGTQSDLVPSPKVEKKAHQKLQYLTRIRQKYKHRLDEAFPYPSSEVLAELSLIPRRDRGLVQGVRRIGRRGK